MNFTNKTSNDTFQFLNKRDSVISLTTTDDEYELDDTTPDQSDAETETISTEFNHETYYNTFAAKFINFISQNPTTYHVIAYFKTLLESHGFQYIQNNKTIDGDLTPGFYYTTKDDLTLIAFVIGGKWKPIHGSLFIGSHCDALSVKINPGSSLKADVNNYKMLGVAPYSGSLTDLWLSRDLGLAGSMLVKDSAGKIKRKLVNSYPDPIAFIPPIAPHFGLGEFEYNQQTQAVPIYGYDEETSPPTKEETNSKLFNRHSLSLLRYISKLSGISISSIDQIDLDLVDVQPSHRGGLNSEFIYSSSLDDRLCAFDSVFGLIEFKENFNIDIKEFSGLNGVYLANHEEIGSGSTTGAKGGFLIDTMKLILSHFNISHRENRRNEVEELANLTTNSIFLSTDVTHAMNPNFKDIYLENNYPLPNVGPSIKFDSNAHVLSDSMSWEFLSRITSKLEDYDIKLQHFHIRNDSRSGGTIGPIMSEGRRGLNGAKMIIDVGLPILSMHSIRSIMGYKDVGKGIKFFEQVFQHWQGVIDEMELGSV